MFTLIAFSANSQNKKPTEKNNFKIEKLLVTPSEDGHREFIDSIKNSKHSVYLKMFHLTDLEVVDALTLAHKRGVDVKVILDRKSLENTKFNKAFEMLNKSEVPVRASGQAFTITHEKSMLIDNKIAFITAINLTKTAPVTRDFGVITLDPQVCSEIYSVFMADWQNALSGLNFTPNLQASQLIWSPINSREKLVKLIKSSKKSLDVQVENLGDSEIQKAFIAAAARGVTVRIVVPMCDKDVNPLRNYPFLKELSKSGVLTKIMPHPSSTDKPYMHSKMILADQTQVYIGSVNFSNNSTQKARELGVIFSDVKATQRIKTEFEKDWKVSEEAKEPEKDFCPKDE